MANFESILSAAQGLSFDDRQRLIDALWVVDNELADEGLDPAWDEELRNRIAAIEADPEKTIPWETIQTRIRANAEKYEKG